MSTPLLSEKLNTETARISWQELQPHFARGATVYVSPDLDLINIAKYMADDNITELSPLVEAGKFGVVTEEQAHQFFINQQNMWALVVAPWVLIQPCNE